MKSKISCWRLVRSMECGLRGGAGCAMKRTRVREGSAGRGRNASGGPRCGKPEHGRRGDASPWMQMRAVGLLLILHTQHLTGSYASGGVAAGAYALGLAISNPLLARQVDLRGQTPILRAGAPVAAAAIITLALLPGGPAVGVIAALGALAGFAQPPVGACMRALWPELLPDADRRHSAYALESVMLEVVYICGPVVIVAGIGSWSTRAAMIACGLCWLVGTATFSTHPVSRGWRPHPERVRDLVGALRGRGVRVHVAVFALCGLAVA